MKDELRILSLIPSATEIICELGLLNRLVGRSHECDFPPMVQNLPSCTYTSIHTELNSKAIDKQVKDKLSQHLSLYELKDGLIKELKPNVVVTQSQCSVCAIDRLEVEKMISELVNNKVKIASLEAKDLEGIFHDIQKIAQALCVPEKGIALIEKMKKQIHELCLQIPPQTQKKRVACIEWIDPLMAAGNWIPSLVELAGATNLFSEKGVESIWIQEDELLSADPDIIIVMACGFDLKRTQEELDAIFTSSRLKSMTAVKNHQFFIVDANQYFIRPGPRIVESLKILCEIMYPEHFAPDFKGVAWDIYPRS